MSASIVPIALKAYFVDGIPVEKTIKENTDIFNFCIRLKTNVKSTPVLSYLSEDKTEVLEIKLNRTNRFYISKTGVRINKIMTESSNENAVIKGYYMTLFNKFKESNDYNINYTYYITECYKIINSIDSKQLELFR